MTTPATPAAPRPSDPRRRQLSEDLSIPIVSNFFPIERYYDAAEKAHAAFRELVVLRDVTTLDEEELDLAYTYGKRYSHFCLDAIPQHEYFRLPRYAKIGKRHRDQVEVVVDQLETVADVMDLQELEKVRIRKIEEARLRAEHERQQQLQFEALQKRAAAAATTALHGGTTTTNDGSSSSSVGASALSKLAALQGVTTTGAGEQQQLRRDPSGESPEQQQRQQQQQQSTTSTTRFRLVEDEDEDGAATGATLPPAIPPPTTTTNGSTGGPPVAAPPAYEQVVGSATTAAQSSKHPLGLTADDNEALRLRLAAAAAPQQQPGQGSHPGSTMQPQQQRPQAKPPQQAATTTTKKPKRATMSMPMAQLQETYKRVYLNLQRESKIRVTPLSTYQGRRGNSTNGCTVISALTAAKHLKVGGSFGITDEQVGNIIDSECGPVLTQIRTKLGLGDHALIIPSDVHDHLVDAKILHQSEFVGAAGGNVMDDTHLSEFLKLLNIGDPQQGQCQNRKAAATLFFREHVISIVKRPMKQHNGVNVKTGASSAYVGAGYFDLYDSLPSAGHRVGTRTRCMDVKTLYQLLRWYTSRKFSESHCTHIDRHAWDDSNADFDPRVFQGFVWCERSRQ